MPEKQKGQTLVVVLLLIMIAAIVASAIAFRVIQDLRRTSSERQSTEASAQVDSFLDVVTNDEVWDSDELKGYCAGFFEDRPLDQICRLEGSSLEDIMDDDQFACNDDGAEVAIRFEADLEDINVEKDSVYEVNLKGSSDGNFQLSKVSGDAESVIIKVYGQNGDDFYLQNAYAISSETGWNNTISYGDNIPYNSESLLARIRPIGGDLVVDITGLQKAQVASVKASCYVGDTYREYVRRVDLEPSVPACFDYVLFDGSTAINK